MILCISKSQLNSECKLSNYLSFTKIKQYSLLFLMASILNWLENFWLVTDRRISWMVVTSMNDYMIESDFYQRVIWFYSPSLVYIKQNFELCDTHQARSIVYRSVYEVGGGWQSEDGFSTPLFEILDKQKPPKRCSLAQTDSKILNCGYGEGVCHSLHGVQFIIAILLNLLSLTNRVVLVVRLNRRHGHSVSAPFCW